MVMAHSPVTQMKTRMLILPAAKTPRSQMSLQAKVRYMARRQTPFSSGHSPGSLRRGVGLLDVPHDCLNTSSNVRSRLLDTNLVMTIQLHWSSLLRSRRSATLCPSSH